MDPNNTNQDQTQQTNPPQTDTATQQDVVQEQPSSDTQTGQDATLPQETSDQSQQTNPPQSDVTGDTTTQQDVLQEQPSSDTQTGQGDTAQAQPQIGQDTTIPQEASDQTLQTDQASQNDPVAASNYIEDVGEDLIDLLDEIETNDNLIEVVAKEMKIEKDRVKSILTGLLDKIDQEQITAEELALIMAAPVADEAQENA